MSAFDLNKGEQQAHGDHAAKLNAAGDNLEDAISVYNDAVAAAFAVLQAEVEKYNAALGEARSFAEDIASERRGEYDERSEKWQESDAGNEVGSFVEEWESFTMDDVSVDQPEALEVELPHGDFENLPQEVSS